jgi:hypothetical protein
MALFFSLVCIKNSHAGLSKTVEVVIFKVETETGTEIDIPGALHHVMLRSNN